MYVPFGIPDPKERFALLLDPFSFGGEGKLKRMEPTFSHALLLQVRQCARYDDYSMGLAGGRYMETIGFMSEWCRVDSIRVGVTRFRIVSGRRAEAACGDLTLTSRCRMDRSIGTERDGGPSAYVQAEVPRPESKHGPSFSWELPLFLPCVNIAASRF